MISHCVPSMKTVAASALIVFLYAHPTLCGDTLTHYPSAANVLEMTVRKGNDWLSDRNNIVWITNEWGVSYLDEQVSRWVINEKIAITDGKPSMILSQSVYGPAGAEIMQYFNTLGYFDNGRTIWLDHKIDEGTISALFRDSYGRDWVAPGTTGIHCHDHEGWRIYRADAYFSYISGLTCDGTGSLWIASREGIRMFNGNSVAVYTGEDGAPEGRVTAAASDRHGTVWFGTNDGVYRFESGKFEHVLTGETHNVLRIHDMAVDQSGALWVCSHRGVLRYDGSGWDVFRESGELIDDIVNDMAIDSNNNKWFCHKSSKNGVTMFNGSEWIWYNTGNSDLPDNNVTSVASGRDGQVWFASGQGIVRYDGSAFTMIDDEENIPVNPISSLFVDSADNLWVVYDQSAQGIISRYNNNGWRIFSTDDGLPDEPVLLLAEDDDGAILVATDKGVFTLDSYGIVRNILPVRDGLLSNKIVDISEDASGAVWFATDYGLTCYYENEWRTYTKEDGLSSDTIASVSCGDGNTVWCIDSNGLLNSFDGTDLYHYSLSDDYPGESIEKISAGFEGDLWCVSDKNRLYTFDGFRFYLLMPNRDDCKDLLYRCLFRFDNRMYVGTDRGVLRYDGDWVYYKAEGPGGPVSYMSIDDKNRLWTTSTKAISRYDGDVWKNWRYKDLGLGGWYNYNYFTSIYTARDGTVWVGGSGPSLFMVSFIGDNWQTHKLKENKNFYSHGFIVDQNEVIWFCPINTPGAISFDDSGWRLYETNKTGMVVQFRFAFVDSTNVKWFVTSGELSRLVSYDDSVWHEHTKALFPRVNLSTAIVDKDNTIWFGTADAGIIRYDRTAWNSETRDASGVGIGPVNQLFISRDSTLWAVADSRLLCRAGDSWSDEYRGTTVQLQDSVNGIFEDTNGMLWVQAEKSLYSLDNGRWHNHPLDIGKNIGKLPLTDADNTIWFTADGALYGLDRSGTNVTDIPPRSFSINGNHPNPFNARTVIEFNLDISVPAGIVIYDVLGRKVRTISLPSLSPGLNSIIWDATGDDGRKVSSGVYIYRLNAGRNTGVGRMTFVK